MGVDLTGLWSLNIYRTKKFNECIMFLKITHLPTLFVILGLVGAKKIEKESARQMIIDAGSTTNMDMIRCSEPPGTVLMSFPEKCLQLVCGTSGIFEPLYLHSKDSCHCCEYNGKLYKEGSVMPGVCFRMYCHKSNWVTTNHVHECCERCDTYMDPHIKTFDARKTPNNWYDVHIPCTFSMVEKVHNVQTITAVRQMAEMYGVYAKFSECWAGVTCVDKITYVDSMNTVVDIDTDSLHLIHLNGQFNTIKDEPTKLCDESGINHQVYAWRYYGCIRLVGSTGIALQICKNYFRILAHSHMSEKIGGLCGKFNFYDQDDHTDKYETVGSTAYFPENPNPEFIRSWMMTAPIMGSTYEPDMCEETNSTSPPVKRENMYCGEPEKEKFKYQCVETLSGVNYMG